MSNIPKPQDTECRTVVLPTEGHANGVLSMLSDYYDVEYDSENDVYKFTDRKQ